MPENKLWVARPPALPYFAELPYYLWGSVNYNSEGDCRSPRDRDWHWLRIQQRPSSASSTDQAFSITVHTASLEIEGSCAEQVAGFFTQPEPAGLRRAQLVQKLFARSELDGWDSMLFWGSWKWIGVFASDLCEVGRWLMLDALRHSADGAWLALAWAKQSPFPEQQRRLVQHAQQACAQSERSLGSLREPDPDTWPAALEAWFAELVAKEGIDDPLLK